MNSRPVKQRSIKVFISSTFRDMHEERDYLNKFVFPRIDEYCNERKIEFYPIDLRWGIQEKDSKNGLVMSACLEQIDEARPFFIGILGSRYGWIPTNQEVNMMRASVERQKPWVIGKVNERASITEIEMEYGVLRNHKIAHACFLLLDESVEVPEDFKEPSGSLEETKLRELKAKIKSQNKYPVYTYKSMKEFGDAVYDSLMEMIESEFTSKSKDNEESLISKHEYVLSRRADTLCDLPSIRENCMQWIDSGHQFLLVHGPEGYGTSTALAMIVSYLRKKYTSKIIYYDFEEENMNGKIVDKLLQFLKRRCNELDPEKWGLIALDNCSTLTQTEVNQLMKWMSDLPVNTHVALAAATTSPASIMLNFNLQPPTIRLHGLSDENKKEFIKNYLLQYGKEVTNNQIDKIRRAKGSEDPSFLTFILNDLVNFGSFENLDGHLNDLLKKSSSGYDTYTVGSGVSDAQRDLSKVGCVDEYAKAMVLLAQMKKIGISEKDICAIADISPAKWAIIRPYVTKWCKGNKSKLVLAKPNSDYAIKMIWSTPWQAEFGVRAIDWFIANKKTVAAANAAMSIWLYIWHLPTDEAIGKEGYETFKRKIFNLACSPDVVLGFDQKQLTWFMEYLLTRNDIRIPDDSFGRSMNDLSLEEQMEYYLRLAQAMKNLNSGTDEAFCYRMVAQLLRQTGQDDKAKCYDASGLLAVGNAREAIDLVQPLIINDKSFLGLFKSKKTYSIEERIISTMALGISCKASIMAGDKKPSYNKAHELMKITGKLLDMTSDEEDARRIAKLVFEAIIDYYAMVCHTNEHDMAFTLYHFLNEGRSLFWGIVSPDYCAQYIHCSSLVMLFCSQKTDDKKRYYEAAYNYSVDAERMAWLAGKEYLQNQAAIIGDYLYYKVNGQYRQNNWQISTNAYNPPKIYTRTLRHHPLKKFDWNKVDVDVRKYILTERDFYRKLIYEIQPDFVRKKMDAEVDKLKKDLML